MRTSSVGAFAKRALLTGIGAAAVLSVAGCGGSVIGTSSAPVTAASSAASTSAAPMSVAGQEGVDHGGRVDVDVEIGDCVRLGGTDDAATIAEAACGSMDSNYKVIAKESRNARCPADADQVYWETRWGTERGALCLDIDWVVGGCMSVPDGEAEPQRVDCGDPSATDVERAVEVVPGVADVERCSEGGFVYDERRFTVCTVAVRPV